MKKTVSTLAFAVTVVAAIFLTSCNSTKKEFELSPDNPSVKGGLKDYVEVVPGSYKLTLQEGDKGYSDGNPCNNYKLIVKLRSKQKTDKHFQEIANPSMDPLSIQLLDANGAPLVTAQFNGSTDGLQKLLKDGEETFFEFSFCFTEGKLKDFAAAKFYMNTNATEYTESTASGTPGSDGEVPATGSQDWDKLLKDYEAYTDKYIELMKKVKNNDMSAVGDYQDMYDKAEKLGNDLEKAQSNLSPDQLNRMMKIQTKLANAAMDMTKQ